MEKKIYERPVMQVEFFLANHYCSGCGPGATTVKYIFKCDGGIGNTRYNVWLDDNPRDNNLTGVWREQVTIFGSNWTWGYNDSGDRDTWLTPSTYYHSCTEGEHIVEVPKGTSVDNIFPYGFMQVKGDRTGEVIPVRIWRGDHQDNIHCTRTLNSEEITPIISFS